MDYFFMFHPGIASIILTLAYRKQNRNWLSLRKSWARVRQAAEMAALDLAADLLRLQALRDSEKSRFCTRWPMAKTLKTPSFETVISPSRSRQARHGMRKPMDRLICGDVGFGKTEVAMRAAFKAAMSGKQVVLLRPPPFVQQHYNSFRDRMLDFPVTVEMISRFRTKAEQRRSLRG